MSDSEFELEFSDDEGATQQALEDAHIKLKQEQDLLKHSAADLAEIQEERRLKSIRDSYQRYLCLQRLDEINLFSLGLLKEQLGLLGVSVDSVMGTFELGCTLNLEELTKFAPNITLIRYKRSVASIKLHHPAVNLGITASGNVSIMGAKSCSELYLAARRVSCLIAKHINPNAKVTKFYVRNIVMQCVYPESIEIAGLESKFKQNDIDCYNPSSFPGFQLKFMNKNLNLVQPQNLNFQNSQNFSNGQNLNFQNFDQNNKQDSTLTGGYVQEYMDTGDSNGIMKNEGYYNGQNQQNFNQNGQNSVPFAVKADPDTITATTTTTPSNDVKAEYPTTTTTTTTTTATTMQNNEQQSEKKIDENNEEKNESKNNEEKNESNSPTTQQHIPIQFPTEFDYTFSAKVFGSGSIIIMGLKSVSMGILAIQIMHKLVKKFNQKFIYTQSLQYGQFVSRSVHIENTNAAAVAANAVNAANAAAAVSYVGDDMGGRKSSGKMKDDEYYDKTNQTHGNSIGNHNRLKNTKKETTATALGSSASSLPAVGLRTSKRQRTNNGAIVTGNDRGLGKRNDNDDEWDGMGDSDFSD